MAPHIIRHTKNRPLTMQRFIEGITGKHFYQKNASEYFPPWIKRQHVVNKTTQSVHEATDYVVCDNVATLVYIANQGCITPHTWLSTIDALHYPDIIIFDLDPAEEHVKDFTLIADAAWLLKKYIEHYNLTAWVMTTGSRGLHVRVPIHAHHTFDAVHAFAKNIAERLVRDNPNSYTLESHKDMRGKKILIDIMRNGFGATAVVPYAVRAHEYAPVATPLEWQELHDATLRADSYTLTTISKRLEKNGDPWENIHHYARTLKI